jgi:1,2-phenylacetyl-CoA epoxidase PaaB subunit
MAKKRTLVPFYGKDVQFFEQQASLSMRAGNPEMAKVQLAEAKNRYMKRKKAHG